MGKASFKIIFDVFFDEIHIFYFKLKSARDSGVPSVLALKNICHRETLDKESRSPAFQSFHKVDGEIPEAEQKKCTCS